MLFDPVFDALDDAGVRFVVVGGLATVLHGYARLTADIDLVIDLEPTPCRAAIDALTGLGLVPRAPVDPRAFADPTVRQSWIADKGMRVLSFYDPARPMLEVDIFAEAPADFEQLWSRTEVVSIGRGRVHIAAIADLIAMKRVAGRPEDARDIEALEEIEKRGGRSVDDPADRAAKIDDAAEPEWGTWEDARRRKSTLGCDATPAERLAWLEQAIALAHATGALPRRREP